MDAYTSFARVYDTFMDNVPYEEWGQYLMSLLKEYQIDDGVVVDLGCGTGAVTEILAKAGYDMIGIDISEDMLNVAMEKKEASGLDILYLLQDMCEVELYSSANAFVSICDSVNYITEPDDLVSCFQNLSRYLEENGVIIFDFNTEHKYRDIIGDTTIAEHREKCSFIWDNYYYEEERINEYELNLFIQEEKDPSLYRKFSEKHYQKAYTLSEMTDIICRSGLTLEHAYDAFTHEPATKSSERIYMIAKK
ncbi:MAG: class I SAM-dependent methyltransferase [Hespellia sp.]|nr:class I SAM-dependent methyltransferase [Hespellia sp.]